MTAPMAALSRLGRAAVQYAARAWKVFPLKPRAKEPLIETGFHGASADPETVRRWWERWPEANIGCCPGASGYLVLDLDGPVGEQTAQRLGLLAEPTLEVQTGREDGGRHLWYRHPGGVIGNGRLGDHLDVRGNAGYVVLPPSIHPSGRVYRWVGRIEEVAQLPAPIVEALRGQVPSDAFAPDRGDKLPAWMLPYLDAAPGKRNETMARFVGWAYGKGHDDGTVLVMAHGLNFAWTAPLPKDEVEAVVRSIGAKHARTPRPSRVTDTGQELALERRAEAPAPEPLAGLAWQQIEAAAAISKQDLSGAPRWAWPSLDALMGPMLPGNFVTVGGLTGNGKTAFLLSQLQSWTEERVPVLYVPLELDPATLRRQWAAWSLGLDWTRVARNDWESLPPGAADDLEAALAAQAKNSHAFFPPDRRITLAKLAGYIDQAVREVAARIVVIDHFHRLDFGAPSQNYRVQVTEAARNLKDLAREHTVVIVGAAQLNQDPNLLDRYFPPTLKRLKESSGLSEEADAVLMLSRRLRELPKRETMTAIRADFKCIRDFEDSQTMVVTCRKHRLDDRARDRSVRLEVHNGRVREFARLPYPVGGGHEPGEN